MEEQAVAAVTGASPDPTTVDVAGEPVTLRRAGAGDPLLFLHGGHFAGRWLPFHDRLAETADMLYPVHPGYERGEAPAWLHGLDDLVLHLRELLDRLAVDRVHAVGHALGAWLAADLAVYCPERVRSLTLLAPFGLRVPGRPLADFLAVSSDELGALLFEASGDGDRALLPDPDDAEAFARFYGENGVTARLMWERRSDGRLDRRLPRVRVPALVVRGAGDRIVPPEHVERWAELLPDCRTETVAGAGHALHVERPDEVAELVGAFIGGDGR